MTDETKTPENQPEEEFKTQEKLKGKLKKANFPEMKEQADAALGEEE